MRNIRLIARLDVKGENLIKGVQLEGLRVIGKSSVYAHEYYNQGADELIFMDCVASLYGRNHLHELVGEATRNIFIPLTVGGGIRTVADALQLLRCGADKLAINTAAVANPSIISDIANKFGSQAMVLSIEAKQQPNGSWEAYTDNGREKTGVDVVDWAKQGVELGAGEILLTSVDREGTRTGFDLDLISAVSSVVSVPVIASGGMSNPSDLLSAIDSQTDAIAMASLLHYKHYTIADVRKLALSSKVNVRDI